jgi:GNAT superfamily N-acetyltransferase
LPVEAKSIIGEPFDSLTLPDRFERGDVLVVCHDKSTVMGYTWLAFKDLWVSEARLFLLLSDDEATTYDAFVFPQYRGRKLYTRIESAALAEAGMRGRKRAFTFVESYNTNSLKTQFRLGKTQVMSVYSIHLMDRFSLHWSTGLPLASRFHK